MAARATRSGRSSLATLVRQNEGRRTGRVLPCAYCVYVDITCPSHHIIVDKKPRWFKFLILEAKVRIIVTRDISTSVVYHDADEVVYNVILKLQGASEIHRSQDFRFRVRKRRKRVQFESPERYYNVVMWERNKARCTRGTSLINENSSSRFVLNRGRIYCTYRTHIDFHGQVVPRQRSSPKGL